MGLLAFGSDMLEDLADFRETANTSLVRHFVDKNIEFVALCGLTGLAFELSSCVHPRNCE